MVIMKNMPKIIAVCGGMHTGKSTAVEILSEMFPEYTVDKFAYPLKVYLDSITNDGIEKLENDSYKSKVHPLLGIAPREALTKIGSTSLEIFSKDIFVDALLARNKGKAVIISDMRLLREANRIRKLGGYIIKIERFFDLRFPGLKEYVHPNNQYNFNDRALSYDHPLFYERLLKATEIDVLNIPGDITIENNGSKDELKREIERLWI